MPLCFTATIFVSPLRVEDLRADRVVLDELADRYETLGRAHSASYGWHALACCGTPFTPMLNHTGELNAARWCDEHVLQLVAERGAFLLVDEVAVAHTPAVIVSATRSMTWFSDCSRSGVPSVPRKYFWATMLVAFCDHVTGNSTSGWKKASVPSLKLVDAGVAPLPLDRVVRVGTRLR